MGVRGLSGLDTEVFDVLPLVAVLELSPDPCLPRIRDDPEDDKPDRAESIDCLLGVAASVLLLSSRGVSKLRRDREADVGTPSLSLLSRCAREG